MKKLLLAAMLLATTALGDNKVLQPVVYQTGSSLTINSGVHVYGLPGSIWDFTGATVTGLDAGGGQPLDSDLTAIAALSTTSYGRSLLTLANSAALKVAVLGTSTPALVAGSGISISGSWPNQTITNTGGGGGGGGIPSTTSILKGDGGGNAAAASASDINTVINSTVAPIFANLTGVDGDLTALAALSGTNTIYYRSASNTWTAVTIGSNLLFSSGTLNAVASGSTTLTGDVTGTGGSTFATTIAANAVTNAKLATMAANTFKGNNTNATANAVDLTVPQMKTALSLNGTNSGDQTITLTGDVTGTGTGSFSATLNKVAITARTEDTTPSLTNDYMLTYDASADALKKVKLSNFSNQLAIDTIKDSTDPTKQLDIDISAFLTATTYTLTPAAGNSVTIIPSSGSTIEAATGVGSDGALVYSAFAARMATVALTGRTASITTTNFLSSNPTAGLYRITYYVVATTAGTSGTLDVTIAFNDGTAARTDVNTAAITFGTTAYATKSVVIKTGGANQVTYAVADNSPVGSPVYSFSAVMERLQ